MRYSPSPGRCLSMFLFVPASEFRKVGQTQLSLRGGGPQRANSRCFWHTSFNSKPGFSIAGIGQWPRLFWSIAWVTSSWPSRVHCSKNLEDAPCQLAANIHHAIRSFIMCYSFFGLNLSKNFKEILMMQLPHWSPVPRRAIEHAQPQRRRGDQ